MTHILLSVWNDDKSKTTERIIRMQDVVEIQPASYGSLIVHGPKFDDVYCVSNEFEQLKQKLGL